MGDLNKIPFGLRESDNALVDVSDVQNGKQCGCVCPSCHTPLEARQGDINAWHFAHASKNVYKQLNKHQLKLVGLVSAD
jgi:competence CoiA-like predicted nuclease